MEQHNCKLPHWSDSESLKNADLLFKFVMMYHDYSVEKQDYGTGVPVTMVEVHTLLNIAESPGITVSELAAHTNRTKGAVSQIIKKLDQQGYIYRSVDKNDLRIVGLYPTEKGLVLNQAHREHDYSEVLATYNHLAQQYTPEELDTFFKVIHSYIQMLQEDK